MAKRKIVALLLLRHDVASHDVHQILVIALAIQLGLVPSSVFGDVVLHALGIVEEIKEHLCKMTLGQWNTLQVDHLEPIVLERLHVFVAVPLQVGKVLHAID